MTIDLPDSDAALVVMGLMLADALLPKSKYDPEVRKKISHRIQQLIEEIQAARDYQGYQRQEEA